MYTSRTCLRILISASTLFGIILCTEGLVLPLPRDLEGVEIGKSKNVFFVQNDVNVSSIFNAQYSKPGIFQSSSLQYRLDHSV